MITKHVQQTTQLHSHLIARTQVHSDPKTVCLTQSLNQGSSGMTLYTSMSMSISHSISRAQQNRRSAYSNFSIHVGQPEIPPPIPSIFICALTSLCVHNFTISLHLPGLVVMLVARQPERNDTRIKHNNLATTPLAPVCGPLFPCSCASPATKSQLKANGKMYTSCIYSCIMERIPKN